MKIAAAIIAAAACFSAYAAMATWTGKSVAGQSITGQFGFNCEFDLYGRKFWMFFTGHCPPSVVVQ